MDDSVVKKFFNNKIKRNRSLAKVLLIIFFISVGYSAVNTNLTISGLINFGSYKYHASQVGYSTVYNGLVNTVEDALNDLFARHKKYEAEEVSYENDLNPDVSNVQEALDELYVKIKDKDDK